jgi:protein-S-isoprenylcysteine O-methyltransferase Ste14
VIPVTVPACLLAALGAACFAAFAWGLRWHFRTPGATPAGVWVISLLSLSAFIWFLWDVLRGSLGVAWPAAMPLFVLAFVLFFAAVRASQSARLTVAFASDQPQVLLRHGPYRYVRHPFYSAYLLFWTAVAIARPGWGPWTVVVAFCSIYWIAARSEEGKFKRSRLVASYATYRRQTGMFLPRPSFLASLTRP